MGESDGCPPPSVEDSSERVGCSAPVDVVGQSIPSSTGASGSEAAGSCENSEGGCQVAVVEVKQVPRCRSAQKVLSESDADGVFPVKPKKTRRRRGQRGRWKPYHRLTTEEKIAKDEREERNAVKKRERLFCHGKPMAPYNTTQFLLEDREKRIVADADVDSTICSSLAHHSLSTTTLEPQSLSPVNDSRRRGVSYSDPGANTSESGIVSDEEVDMLEKEFEIDYDNANLLRIDKMSREQNCGKKQCWKPCTAVPEGDVKQISSVCIERCGFQQVEAICGL
ncbi:hypothetical protein AB6A40_007313 [Gnathostoma spinigerum]|uniref:Uncharacterized protein n=1 Tax=Gnathostoma spinigerum TaxID=75299 RepID=A0ABD6ER08_9BILA